MHLTKTTYSRLTSVLNEVHCWVYVVFLSFLCRYTLIDQKMSSTLMQSVDIQLINAAQSIVYNVFAQDAPGGGTPHHHSQHTNLQVRRWFGDLFTVTGGGGWWI